MLLPMECSSWYLGRVLTNNFSQEQIIEYNIQFSSITNIGDELTCSAKVVKTITNGTRKNLKLELKVTDQNDDLKLKGYSLIKILWILILAITS